MTTADSHTSGTSGKLLTQNDPEPVDSLCVNKDYRGALVCEHGGRHIPQTLDKLGLPGHSLDEHIAYDIGAKSTARLLAFKLSVPLVVQRYSRLVIDCNRPPSAPDSMPALIHGTAVPGNVNLNEELRQQRVDEIFTPYNEAVKALLECAGCQWAFSIHSFTPELGGKKRPWDIGFLFRKDNVTSIRLSEYLQLRYPEFTVGLNKPYAIDDESDWFVPQHAERLGLQHSLVEIRNDHITSSRGQEFWAGILAEAIENTIE